MKRRVMASQDSCQNVQLVERNEEPLGLQLVSSYSVGRKGCSDLVELAKEISKADNFVKANATSKLELIAKQMRFLQQQAYDILKEAKQSSELHHAACNFHKIPEETYYLYRRPSGQKYFSMLSPDDWNGAPPHDFLGSFRLEHDMTWTPSSCFESKTDNLYLVNKLMDLNNVPCPPIDQGHQSLENMMME